jgi:ATP-dependent DNA helicase RecQ
MFLLLVLATATPKVQEDILKNLDMSDATTLKHPLTGQIYITKYVPNENIESDIIFVLSKNQELLLEPQKK